MTYKKMIYKTIAYKKWHKKSDIKKECHIKIW
jgi:hypothetical protein